MLQRCYNIKNKAYKNYGGRGIDVCPLWQEFVPFYDDMGSTWKKGLTLERMDNNKGYSPDNCKWATRKENCNNTRNTRIVLIKGVQYKFTEAVEKFGISIGVANARYKREWSDEDIFLTPVKDPVTIVTVQGEKYTFSEAVKNLVYREVQPVIDIFPINGLLIALF